MHGFGGLVSFELSGGLDKVEVFIQALGIPKIGQSLGGVETLVSHPASMVYYDFSDEQLEQQGISKGLVRLSVGIEDCSDLIADIKNALRSLE
jgi:cystathionine beta-lyase/cystathionine gamma-synthase